MKKRILALAMTLAMCLSLLPMTALATGGGTGPTPDASTNPEGLHVSKIATANNDGSYTLTMEAYTTGTVTSSTSSRPTDIVLVLDMSGSMDATYTTYTDTYTAVLGKEYTYKWFFQNYTGYGFNNNDTYYIKNGETYQQLRYGGMDKNGYEYFYYATGSFLNRQYHYYYPQLNTNVTGAPLREYTDVEVVQFYTKKITSKTVNKLESLKAAVNSFIDLTAQQNEGVAEAKQHRISIVKFAGTEKFETGNDTYTEYGHKYNYSQIVTGLTSVTTETAQSLKDTVQGLSAAGATAVDKGLSRATAALGEASSERNQVVVVFTDGEPTYNSDFEINVANAAILKAKDLKSKDVAVYSVCIDKGANVGTTLPGGNTNINRFMHLLSSNYPNATAMNTPGNGGDPAKGYYMVPGEGMSLAGVFEKISQNIASPAIQLGAEATLVDTVTPYFDVVEGEGSVTVKEVPCTGVDEDGNYKWGDPDNSTIEPTVDGDKVTVTGFDYDANFVSGTPRTVNGNNFYGKKLVVEVKVTPKAGFWGGNNVPTNLDTSGIYNKEDQKIGTFPVPTVNVPLNVPDLEGKTVNIYCGNAAPSARDLVDETGAFFADQNSWKTAFVNVGNVALQDTSASISNVEDGNYTVQATVTPKHDPVAVGTPAEAVPKNATGTVHVYKPVITFQDTTINQGETPNYDTDNKVGIVWKHGTGDNVTNSENVTMMGTAPTLALTYDPVAKEFTQDSEVAVTIVQSLEPNTRTP